MRPTTLPSQPADYLPLFQKLLPTSVLSTVIQEGQGRFYQRIFTPLVLLWGFVYQRLDANGTCDSVLDHLSSGVLDEWEQANRRPGRVPVPALSKRLSKNNSAYCQGRGRLSPSVLESALRQTAKAIWEEMGEDGLYKGYRALLVDGNTLQLQATQALIEHYGRQGNQNGPSHWPLLRMVTAFDLRSGAILDCEEGPLKAGEQQLTFGLFKRLSEAMDMPTVCIADSNFGIFSVIQAIRGSGADVLVRLTPARYQALVKRLGLHSLKAGEEHSIIWTASSQDQLDQGSEPVPGRLLYIRLERNGFEPKDLYLFTTLGEEFSFQELVEFYGLRWHVELSLRYVKSTLQLEKLVSKSVEMVRKELLAGLIAYNLIRGFMAQAAQLEGISPLSLSFMRCWRCLTIFGLSCTSSGTIEQIADKMSNLMRMMGGCRIQKRKPRSNVRCLRLDRRKYPVFKGPRNKKHIQTMTQW